ncbi:MFS transporter [Parahaliea maris]|uniref:MFS transporter n=1 Tax=Parahaliea maris TaxID=2716870 RepID=A0A5C9A5I2_9GAMM|nr:MFS transporter [Parahaliea maris]TXS95284.1 MFS transporter [Parahaliea maris]
MKQEASTTVIPDTVRHYVLGILLLTYVFNFVDRQILAILLSPIKSEMGFSDSALGFLTGFGFALFYVAVGIPMAMWADRGNRRNIIALSLTIWSGMTALCGLAQNFVQLALARIGVGIGEAGCSPPAHSMIADLYGQQRRATALAIYSLGVPFGVLLGFVIGGWVNELYGWRMAFLAAGIPGLVLAFVVRFTLPEPPRGLAENRPAEQASPTLSDTIGFLLRRPAFIHMVAGGALSAFVGYAVLGWIPSVFIRSHGMTTGEVGTWLGLILGIPGGLGIMLGGHLADSLGATDRRWSLWIVSVAQLVAMPFYIAVFLSGDANSALWFLVVPVALGNFYQATTFAQTQGLVPLRMRATAAAIMLFVLNVIGLGLGPTTVGLLSDVLGPRFGDDSLRYSLTVLSLACLWAAYHYYKAGQHLPHDLVALPDTPLCQDDASELVDGHLQHGAS